MGIKNVFMVLIACVILFFVLKVVPILNRGTLGIRGICAACFRQGHMAV